MLDQTTGLIIAGWSTIISICVSGYLIKQHIQYNNDIKSRTLVIRIIFMVPIYAIESFLGLYAPEHALYFDVCREIYEALVIYCFFALLLHSLGGEDKLIQMLRYKDDIKHLFPLRYCLPTWAMTYIINKQNNDSSNDSDDHTRDTIQINSDKSTTHSGNTIFKHLQDNNNYKVQQSNHRNDYNNDNNTNTYQPPLYDPQIQQITVSTNDNNGDVNSEYTHESFYTPVKNTNSYTNNHSYINGIYKRNLSINNEDNNNEHTIIQSDFLLQTQLGTLQYCVFKPITALIIFLLQVMDLYNGDSFFDLTAGNIYLAIFNSISQTYAMYCLILFYTAFKHELSYIKPISKFICVKMVVFATFWQSVLLSIAVSLNIIHDYDDTWTSDTISAAIQDFVVCIEMLIAAIAHHYAFKVSDFVQHSSNMLDNKQYINGLSLQTPVQSTNINNNTTNQPIYHTLMQIADFSDVYVTDVKKARQQLKNKLGTDTPLPSLIKPLLYDTQQDNNDNVNVNVNDRSSEDNS